MTNNNYDFDFNNETETLYLIRLNDKGEETSREVLSAHFYPKKVTHDVDSGEIGIVLHAEYRGKVVEKSITRDQLQSSKLAELSKYGFPFSDSYVRKMIFDWILEIEEQLNLEEVTKELGWKKYDGKKYFQLSEAVSRNNEVQVKYEGNITVGKSGAWKDYLKFLEMNVIPYMATQAIIAFSAASALAAYINPELTIIFHMEGASTTGKTTMIQLAASVWGSPEITMNGVAKNWNTTNNALISDLKGINGLTLCFDELGASNLYASNLIYIISGGNDKNRLNDTEPHKPFAVNILSSGELPMNTVNGINGITVRLLEFHCQWTDSKAHSEAIKRGISECYGQLGAKFAKAVMSYSKDSLIAIIDEVQTKIIRHYADKLESLPKSHHSVLNRAIQKISVITAAAIILKKITNLDFKPYQIAKFIIEKSSLLDTQIDDCMQFLEVYLEIASRHIRINKSPQIYRSNLDNRRYIIARREYFYDVMYKHEYTTSDCNRYLRELKKRGFLHCESGRLYYRRDSNGYRTTYIELDTRKLDSEGIFYDV